MVTSTNQPTDWQGEYRAICLGRWNGRVLQVAEKSTIHLYEQSFYRHRPICLIFPLNPSNENVSRVYRVFQQSTLWELIGGQWSRQLSDPAGVYWITNPPCAGRIHQSREDCGTRLDSLCLFYFHRLQMSHFASDLSCSKCREWWRRFEQISGALRPVSEEIQQQLLHCYFWPVLILTDIYIN